MIFAKHLERFVEWWASLVDKLINPRLPGGQMLTDRRSPARVSNCGCKSETAPLLIPVERQACVIHETARGQFRRMSAVEDRADDVRRQNREAKEPCRIGRYDALCFGNVL